MSGVLLDHLKAAAAPAPVVARGGGCLTPANPAGVSDDVLVRFPYLPRDIEGEGRLDLEEAKQQHLAETEGVDFEPLRFEAYPQAPKGARAAPVSTQYRIITRRESGLPLSQAPTDPQTKTEGFVHYTADDGRRLWSQASATTRLKGYYRYHTQVNGWADIGYHFIVFQGWYGRKPLIFEGRPVRRIPAAQANHNSGTIAVCVVADANDHIMLSTADAVAWLFWRFRYLRTVGGHRQVVNTSCPGNNLYARVPLIAQRAECAVYPRNR